MTDGPHAALRVLQWVGLLLGGLALGASGALVQRSHVVIAGHVLPWGAVVVLVTLAAAVRGAVWWARRRPGGIVVAAGWLLVSLLLAQSGPGGDVLLPDDWRSQVYLLGGVVVALVAVVVPLPRRDPPAPTGEDSTDDGSVPTGVEPS